VADFIIHQMIKLTFGSSIQLTIAFSSPISSLSVGVRAESWTGQHEAKLDFVQDHRNSEHPVCKDESTTVESALLKSSEGLFTPDQLARDSV
jgi:hypothetical protein